MVEKLTDEYIQRMRMNAWLEAGILCAICEADMMNKARLNYLKEVYESDGGGED